ncbi:MAG: GTPase HflX [Rhodospirillales bacterium CG15_BIG_FIL_POST_REV_8_21_14_020_66_15]|nr:MAG: GTPase HflX [Rhodospirillales bacterium CG15_BIG_FIL_POST_REV_8_21_14_020_66_15]
MPAAAAEGRSARANLDEAVALAGAIDLEVVHAEAFELTRPRPATLLGKGAVERIAETLKSLEDCDLAVVNANLTPVQQRNLETAWNVKVIDRTGLILEIFGARARTKEGRLQVDLAALSYQLGRLVRSWTHLERQRGGAGFMGGPGERQIELDRRLIRQRIARLKRELAEVKRTRSLQRRARQRVPYPVVALVGYTNAGKSTLFNRLTGADVVARDQLFATLDPTMRRLDLPGGGPIILSDTVGFISDLPHQLVNAFHATLEEVVEADMVLHVRDIADPETEIQRRDVLGVLNELGMGEDSATPITEAWNKIDLLTPEDLAALEQRIARQDNNPPVAISAVTGQGLDRLTQRIQDQLGTALSELDLDLGFDEGATLAWLYEHGEVLDRRDGEAGIHLRVRLDARTLSQLSMRIDSARQRRLH